MADGIIASFPKNNREVVAAELSPFQGTLYAHVRILVPSAVDDGWIHTDMGVAIEASRVNELKTAVDKLADVASRDILVGRIAVGREEIRVGVNTYRSNAYAYLRRFYQQEGTWRPSRRGVSVAVDLTTELVDLVHQLAEAAGG